MSQMAKGWTMIRVREGTADWIREECERLAIAHEKMFCDVPEYGDRQGNQLGCGISVDALLVRLLNNRRRHRERRRAAAARRRAGKVSLHAGEENSCNRESERS